MMFKFFSALVFLSAINAAHAMPPEPTGWHGTVGAAVVSTPEYMGSDDADTQIFPDLGIHYKDTFFASVPQGMGYKVINNGTWLAGPILKYDFGRDEDDASDNSLQGMGDVDGAAEIGAFVEFTHGSISTKLEARQAARGHKGFVADLHVKYNGQKGKTFYSVGPHVQYGDEDYANAYFGVSASQAATSNFAVHAADAGITRYGASAAVIHPLNTHWALTGLVGYDTFTADDSPIVKAGRDDAMTAVVGLGYRFDLSR